MPSLLLQFRLQSRHGDTGGPSLSLDDRKSDQEP